MQQAQLERVFVPEVSGNSARAARAAASLERLTWRQQQVLEGMVGGLLNKEIADWLGIDEKTVKMHRSRLIARLQVRSSADAIRLGVEASFHVQNEAAERFSKVL